MKKKNAAAEEQPTVGDAETTKKKRGRKSAAPVNATVVDLPAGVAS